MNGPKSELDKTIYSQPAVLVTSLAAVEKLRHEEPAVIFLVFSVLCGVFGHMVTCYIASLRSLRHRFVVFQAIDKCVATAGFSVGEFAALVFGGALSFEDGKNFKKSDLIYLHYLFVCV